MRRIRQIHQYLGTFFAPAILFFAFTGALQTFGLHENRGGDYQPPAWIAALASVHKDQTLPHPRPASAAQGEDGDHDHAGAKHPPREEEGPSPLPLKIFVLALALSLIVTTLLGIYIALSNRNTRTAALACLGAGTVLPLVLLFL